MCRICHNLIINNYITTVNSVNYTTDNFDLEEWKEASLGVKKSLKSASNEFESDVALNEYDICTRAYAEVFIFLHYLLTQYTRTEKSLDRLRASWIEICTKIKNENDVTLNPENMLILNTHLTPHILSRILIENKFRIVFLENITELGFITSDNPVINIHAHDGEKAKGLEYYFPLSPNSAIILSKEPCYQFKKSLQLTKEQVLYYNRLIEAHAYRFIITRPQE